MTVQLLDSTTLKITTKSHGIQVAVMGYLFLKGVPMKLSVFASCTCIALSTLACQVKDKNQNSAEATRSISVTENKNVDPSVGGFQLADTGSDVTYETVWTNIHLSVTEYHIFGTIEANSGEVFTVTQTEATNKAKQNRDSVWGMMTSSLNSVCKVNGGGNGVLRYQTPKTSSTGTGTINANYGYASANSYQNLGCEAPKLGYVNQAYCAGVTGNPGGYHVDVAPPQVGSQTVTIGVPQFSVAAQDLLITAPNQLQEATESLHARLKDACTAAGAQIYVAITTPRPLVTGYAYKAHPVTGVHDWFVTATTTATYACCKVPSDPI